MYPNKIIWQYQKQSLWADILNPFQFQGNSVFQLNLVGHLLSKGWPGCHTLPEWISSSEFCLVRFLSVKKSNLAFYFFKEWRSFTLNLFTINMKFEQYLSESKSTITIHIMLVKYWYHWGASYFWTFCMSKNIWNEKNRNYTESSASTFPSISL